MVLVAAIALGSSTYAWFVNNANVTAARVNVTASTAYSLLISHDNSTWGTTTQDLNNNLASLLPASTLGTLASAEVASDINSTNKNGVGDLLFVTDKTWEGNYVTAFNTVAKADKVTVTEPNGTTTTDAQYFYTDKVYMKSAQDGKIYLDATNTGIGADVDSDGVYTYSAAFSSLSVNQKALLETLRVGLVVKHNSGDPEVFVYQITDETGTANVITTTGNGGADGISKTAGVTADGVTKKTDVPSFANLDSSDNVPVISDCMATGSSSALATGTSGKDIIATVDANEVITVEIYVWMEGCDEQTVAGNIADFAGAQIQNMMFGFCLGAV